ncbi:MAG: hypothetical protein IKE66_06585 [Hyphomicrobium sp.]|nr:hypothetical protein [Hyphomicrobium sp.]
MRSASAVAWSLIAFRPAIRFQHRIVQIRQICFDCFVEAIDPLIGFCDPLEVRELFTAALGAVLASIKKAAENGCKALGLERVDIAALY